VEGSTSPKRKERHSMLLRKGQLRKVMSQNHQMGPFSLRNYLKRMAGTTRLELATSAVTGQRSNQLNYVPTRFSYG
jgi:hypothetical protein